MLLHRVDGSMPASVPPVSPVGRVVAGGEGMQLGTGPGGGGNNGGQDTPSESSEAESSECDTTGDEDGWESGESSASLVLNKRQSHATTTDTTITTTHGTGRNNNTHDRLRQHRASLGARGCAEPGGSFDRGGVDGDKRDNNKQRQKSTFSIRRSSGLFFRSSAPLDT